MVFRRVPFLFALVAAVGGLVFAAVLVWAPTVVAVAVASSLFTLLVAAELLHVLATRKMRALDAEAAEQEGSEVQYRLVGGPGDGDRIPAPPPSFHEFADLVARQMGVDDFDPRMRVSLPEYPGGYYEFSDEEADALVWVDADPDGEGGRVGAMPIADPFALLRSIPVGAKAAAALRLLNDISEQHEWEEHGGEICLDRRLDVLATVALGLGLEAGHFDGENEGKFASWIREVDEETREREQGD